MSATPGLGSFNKDKVANKFGIQLKPKDASQRSATDKKPITTSSSTSNVTKNKTISDFRTDNSTNGVLLNTTRPTPATKAPPEPAKKPLEKTAASKSTSVLVNTSANNDQRTSNVNHSTTKSKESLTPKSPSTSKRSSITPTERAVSPAPPPKRPSVTKTEAQPQHLADKPLYNRQSSKPLENTSSKTTAAAAAAATTKTGSATSLKR